MSGDLVRVRHEGVEFNTGRFNAVNKGFEVLDEPTHKDDGSPRRATRLNGRPRKPKTSVAEEAAKKSAEKAASAAPIPAAGQLRPDTKE